MIVETAYGRIKGCKEEGIACFKGVPYAKPPVGELRWKSPVQPDAWEGVRSAEEYANASAQVMISVPGAAGVSRLLEEECGEDCLYLNIWTPASALTSEEKLPVVVMYHGGGFVAFSGAYYILRGRELAKQGIVVVNVNYRLGVMGYFAHPKLSEESSQGVSGNYGLLDQIQALRWVKDNIKSFGGDPDRITISGESAGAFSVSMICKTPLAKGLFVGATAQSGAFFDHKTGMYRLKTLKEAEETGLRIADGRTIEELRKLPAMQLVEETAAIAAVDLIPNIDGWLFPADSEERFRTGEMCDVPLLIGYNREDGSKFHSHSGNPEELSRIACLLYGEEALPEFCAVYPMGSKEETEYSQTLYTGDTGFGHNMYRWAKLAQKYGKYHTYLYYYCHVPPADGGLGAYHSSELVYMNRTMSYMDKEWRPSDYRMQEVFSGYYLNFIKSGNPNGQAPDGSMLPEWTPFEEDDTRVLILEDEPHMAQNERLSAMAFFDRYGS